MSKKAEAAKIEEAKEVAHSQTTALASVPEGAWGSATPMASDLIIPRISIMQGMSELMKDKKLGARLGEIRESLEGRLLSDGEKPLIFIPFYVSQTWVLREKRNGKYEYAGVEPRTTKNDDAPWEYTERNEEGKDVEKRRERTINAYILVPSEIDSGEYLPYLLSFTRTSFKSGKKFMTLLEMMRQSNLAPAQRNFELRTAMEENEKGSWYIPEVKKLPGATKPEHLAAAYNWYKSVSAGAVKVDEPVAEEAEEAVPAGTREY